MKVVGVDVGGTFTDVVLADLATGALTVEKLPTTPARPVGGGGRRHRPPGRSPGALAEVRHGTTIATNTDARRRRGARVGMITTEGFRDVLHLGAPPAAAALLDPPGGALAGPPARPRAPSQDRARAPRAAARRGARAARRGRACGARRASCEAEGVEAVAVCFLFSYLDPVHEERAARARARGAARTPSSRRRAPSTRSSASSSASRPPPLNAYVGPPVRAYLERLGEPRCARPASAGASTSCARTAAWRRRRRRPREPVSRCCCRARPPACSAAPTRAAPRAATTS